MQNMWTNYYAKHSWDCERLKNVGKEMVKHNFGHSFNNFYLVFKERNYLVPYKFSFRQIIWIQVTPTDRFKIFWKNLIEKTFLVDSWQINKKSCKIVFHNVPDRFMTESKILGQILMQNIPDIFGRDSKKFWQNHLEKHFLWIWDRFNKFLATYSKTILIKRLQENVASDRNWIIATLMYGGNNSVISCDWWHFL